ncbi:MAG: hydrogenase iron-sulfur subunit [Dehalococcoidia bacterium]|jgi:F420-non-reducing hydrogenase iron-sulfur subunit
METAFAPKIVGFLCNWCSYAGADLAGATKLEVPSSLSVIRVMCSGRVDPVLVATALLHGADGVLVAGCHPGDCHYREGNYYARRRFALLKKTWQTLGLDSERIMLAWVSASEGQRFKEVATEFAKQITEMGPNPMKAKTSL